MFGITGTPYTTVLNPLGSVTMDIMQMSAAAKEGDGIVNAALLGLGFNLRP